MKFLNLKIDDGTHHAYKEKCVAMGIPMIRFLDICIQAAARGSLKIKGKHLVCDGVEVTTQRFTLYGNQDEATARSLSKPEDGAKDITMRQMCELMTEWSYSEEWGAMSDEKELKKACAWAVERFAVNEKSVRSLWEFFNFKEEPDTAFEALRDFANKEGTHDAK